MVCPRAPACSGSTVPSVPRRTFPFDSASARRPHPAGIFVPVPVGGPFGGEPGERFPSCHSVPKDVSFVVLYLVFFPPYPPARAVLPEEEDVCSVPCSFSFLSFLLRVEPFSFPPPSLFPLLAPPLYFSPLARYLSSLPSHSPLVPLPPLLLSSLLFHPIPFLSPPPPILLFLCWIAPRLIQTKFFNPLSIYVQR